MERWITLAAVAALATAGASQVYVVDGVQYVNPEAFARENGLSYANQYGTLTFTRGGVTVVMYTGSREGQVSGKPVALAGPVTNAQDTLLVPLLDLQQAFGFTVTAQPAPPAPKVAVPAQPTIPQASIPTATSAAGAKLNPVAPNGYFKPGSAEYPSSPIKTANYSYTPMKSNLDSAALFASSLLNIRYALDGTKLTPDTIYNVCIGEALNSLKSPSTAQFSNVRLIGYPNKAWMAVATVDSQNGYGAMVRGTVYCNLRVNGKALEGVVDIITRR